jgi:hypothetical protein
VEGISSDFGVYGADVSSLAGLTGELRFTGLAPRPFGLNGALLDDINFSPIPVPEPGSLALLALGLLGTLWWRRRRSRRPHP